MESIVNYESDDGNSKSTKKQSPRVIINSIQFETDSRTIVLPQKKTAEHWRNSVPFNRFQNVNAHQKVKDIA